MNTKIKQLTLLASAGLLLVACGQGKKEESTQAQTTQATTQAQATTTAPTQTTKAAQSDTTEVKNVYELVNTNVTTKLTLYSKGNIIERTITEVSQILVLIMFQKLQEKPLNKVMKFKNLF